ncbi:hypothetical protein GPZ05_14865 [Listeria monocytogenes]|nr:hypothetical protein [Listeria monocytogenes]EDN7515080.1 hypothetical protein [Listeria monocytogenes]
MKKKTKIILSILASLLIILILMPPLSPIFFKNSSEKGVIRHEIYKQGYPYQSYFTILKKKESDDSSSSLYSLILFNAWKNKAGNPSICYSKKVTEGEYKVTFGTAP